MLFDRLESKHRSAAVWDIDKKPICMRCAFDYTFGRVTFVRPMVDKFCHATYSSAHARVFLEWIFFTYWLFWLMMNELSWSITIFFGFVFAHATLLITI